MDTISIGITCYNAEGSIEAAVRSAQQQSWPQVEIVVVDDHSSDQSGEILRRLASQDPRIHVVRHPENRGVGAARNTLLEHATGAFVAFFDDDDESRPERLTQQHRHMVEYETATGATRVLCGTASTRVYPDGSSDYAPCLGTGAAPGPSGEAVARLILLGKPTTGTRGVFPTSTQMARRSTYASVGGFDPSLRRHEDTDLNLRLALQGAHFTGLAEPLVTRHMTATDDKSLRAEHQGALALIEKHRELLQRWGWYDFNRLWCDMKFARLEGGVHSALPPLLRLLARSPAKLMRKLAWTLPNRPRYSKYRQVHGAGA